MVVGMENMYWEFETMKSDELNTNEKLVSNFMIHFKRHQKHLNWSIKKNFVISLIETMLHWAKRYKKVIAMLLLFDSLTVPIFFGELYTEVIIF